MHTSKQIWWGVIFALIIGYSALIVPSIHAAEKVLRVRYGGDISGIDPARIFQIENQTIALNVYNGLVRYEEKTNQIIPDLATKWDITDGGKTYTFHLRQGVTFHKGFGTFTAEDVKLRM